MTRSHIAIIGAGMAGVVAARTLTQAGHRVTLLEKSRGFGGRMSNRRSDFGGFDHGAQYFTVRDPRFQKALTQTAQSVVAPWQASTVRVLDDGGRVLAAAPAPKDTRFVAVPGMNALVAHWAAPLVQGLGDARVLLNTRVTRIERDRLNAQRWQLCCESTAADAVASPVLGGFDKVLVAVPHVQALDLLRASQLAVGWQEQLQAVSVAPCWTLMLAFPHAVGGAALGPSWHAARSGHHRIAWLARETSKPGRGAVERWTVQASPAWSARHLEDDEERVKAKLVKGFAEITGIRTEPAHAAVHRWLYAQTDQALGVSHLLDRNTGLGLCGDWCLGNRVEAAFVSGLELAMALK
jgi:predicted NAD/FAD-dependent oxidoreductase